MRRSKTAALLTLVSLIACPCFGGEAPPEWSDPSFDFDFGRKVVMVRMRTTAADGRFTEGFLERVKIRRLEIPPSS